jgi:drug/metabolite transporter (DMT)-like permease
MGVLLFILAALMFSIYLIFSRLWQVTVPQLLLILSVISGLIYIPVWALFLPSALAETEPSVIVLQGFYQILPNLVGMNLLALAVRHVGASLTAAIMSAVPSLGAILGVLILGESLGAAAWLGIAILSLGILLTALQPRGK